MTKEGPKESAIERCESRCNLTEGLPTVADGVKVDALDDVDAGLFIMMPVVHQSPNRFLERSGCSTSTVDFTVKQSCQQQRRLKLVEGWVHQGGFIGPGETPAEIAGGVSHVGSNAF